MVNPKLSRSLEGLAIHLTQISSCGAFCPRHPRFWGAERVYIFKAEWDPGGRTTVRQFLEALPVGNRHRWPFCGGPRTGPNGVHLIGGKKHAGLDLTVSEYPMAS